MKIEALQKLTLLDFPEKMACTVFTHGCNFRCPFCHNAPLVTDKPQEHISEEEFFGFLKTRGAILDGVCVTGGEPLIQSDIDAFLAKIKEMGFLVKLDTNGSFSSKLRELCEKGLVDYVAVDIKNSKEKYADTIGKADFDTSEIEKTVDFLVNGKVDYEFRTTVTKDTHTLDDLLKIADWIGGCKKYYIQQFVDSGMLIDSSVKGYDDHTLRGMFDILKEKLPQAELRGI